jgi:MFS transporter, MHS family, proline/betaine transporter
MHSVTISPYSVTTKLKAFLFAILGTVVEYYDYALYGFCASHISRAFFPNYDPTVSLIHTFSIFALGSLAKPLGSLLFGWIGDMRGRKHALKWSMTGIAIPTLIIALVPDYTAIGWYAPLILVISRFTQGFFVSGEFDGVRVFVYETLGKKRPYLANSMVGLAAYVGIFLASFFSALYATSHWRFPFLLGGIAGLIVMLLRRYIIESEDYLHTQTSTSFAFQKWLLKPFIATILLCGAVGGSYHIFFVYLNTHLSSILYLLSPGEASWVNTLLLACYIPGVVMSSWSADYYGPFRTLWPALLLVFISGLSLIFLDFSLWKLYPLASALGFLHGPIYVLLLKQFPLKARYRCIGLGHSLGSMLFSGSAPLLCTKLWQLTAFAFAPIIYLLILAILIFIGLLLIKPERI